MSTTTMTAQSQSKAALVGPVAERVLNHMGDEIASLEGMLSAVRSVHHALQNLNDEALRTSLAAEARELASNIAIQERRRRLQNELAAAFQMSPQDVTLRRLVVMASGSVRDSLERVWQSLTEMASETERLNRQNAAMIGQSLAIVRGVVERLTGVTGVGESYNAVGVRAETHVGPLIQWGA